MPSGTASIFSTTNRRRFQNPAVFCGFAAVECATVRKLGEAARVGGVTLQVVRDWVLRFNALGPAGLIDRKAPGQPPRLGADHRAALAEIIDSGPIPAVHGVVRWRLADLCQWLRETFAVSLSPEALGRTLRRMGYRKLSARPRHHAQAAGAIEAFKPDFNTGLRKK